MLRTILGKNELIDVEHVANVLRTLARHNVATTKEHWRATAEWAILWAREEAEKKGGSTASAEDLFMLIFNRAVDGWNSCEPRNGRPT